jgi:hypothetical protein
MKKSQPLVSFCAYFLFVMPYGITNAATVTLSPDPLDMFINETRQMIISIDEIAPPGGVEFMLSSGSGIISTPHSVMIQHGSFTNTIDVFGISAGSDTLIAFGSHYGSDNAIVNVLDPVPIPAAIWLFGTGLMGLIGLSKRKKFAW